MTYWNGWHAWSGNTVEGYGPWKKSIDAGAAAFLFGDRAFGFDGSTLGFYNLNCLLHIDPKPFIGDRAYDATQHLLNCQARLRRDPHGTIERFADLLEVSDERVRLWLFARAAAGPRDDDWKDN